MPLPLSMLRVYSAASVEPAPEGSESWVLVVDEPPGAPQLAKPGPAGTDELRRRLDQAGLDWTPVRIASGDWSSDGVCVSDISRARALRLGHKLRRWAVLRVCGGRLDVLYTGVNERGR